MKKVCLLALMAGAFIMPPQHIQAANNTASIAITVMAFAVMVTLSYVSDMDQIKRKSFKNALSHVLMAGISSAFVTVSLLMLVEKGVITPKLIKSFDKKF